MNNATHFANNPFFLLGASTLDARQKIVALAQEKSLEANHEECNKARADLTSPRLRIAAELGWPSGMDFNQAKVRIEQALADPFSLKGGGGNPLDQANLLAAALQGIKGGVIDKIALLIFELSLASDNATARMATDRINLDRRAAGFPEASIEHVEEELSARKVLFRTIAKATLDRMPSKMLVSAMNQLVSASLDGLGRGKCPSLVAWLVDLYEKSCEEFFEKQEATIVHMCDRVYLASIKSQTSATEELALLQQVVDRWNAVIEPVHVYSKISGIEKVWGLDGAISANKAAVSMWNTHQLAFKWHCDRMIQIASSLSASIPEAARAVDNSKQGLEEAARSHGFGAQAGRLLRTLAIKFAVLFVIGMIIAAIRH